MLALLLFDYYYIIKRLIMKEFKKVELTAKNVLLFAIPALIGVILYLTPMTMDGKTGMLIGLLLSKASSAASGWSMQAAIALMSLTALATLIAKIA